MTDVEPNSEALCLPPPGSVVFIVAQLGGLRTLKESLAGSKKLVLLGNGFTKGIFITRNSLILPVTTSDVNLESPDFECDVDFSE